MKMKLTSFYGDNAPGDVIDVDDSEAVRLRELGGAVAAPAEPAQPKVSERSVNGTPKK
ncbi:MAG: hypothetical protein Q8M31_18380 [Beijerinckiaceae bacterium]|nr:hypothetical protein [Beijerinckiaceae bacterium]